MDESSEISGKGRGRGRGGGVPLLPVGMWNDINNTTNEQGLESSRKNINNDFVESNNQALEEMKQMTFGGYGRGRGKMGFNDRGPGSSAFARGGEWICSSCGNENWSWRTNCNRCSNPKPIVKVYTEGEIRDGAGGGFNERQDRVAATTVEITEDGFDDFGRKVKGGKQDKSAKELAALARLQNDYSFLLNPESVLGQFEDSQEVKLSKKPNPGQNGSSKPESRTTSAPQGKSVPPKSNSDQQSKQKMDGKDRRSRSRDRRDKQVGGTDKRDRDYRHERERSRERRERSRDRRERSRDRDRHQNTKR